MGYGQIVKPVADALTPEDLRMRKVAASQLCEAIADAHPDDAVQILSAALADLTANGQRPDFFLDAEAEARWWTSIEPPETLVIVLKAVLARLGNRAIYLSTRKRLFWTLWTGFDPAERAKFMAKVKGAQA